MNTLILLTALGVGNPPPGPLHCPAPAAARGDVKGGPPLAHTFDLTHTGQGTLTITKVEAGCGCLRQVLTTTTLQPGETAKLTLEVNTLTQPDGPNRWQAQVSYTVATPASSPQPRQLLLQISATLAREVSVTPPQVAFSCTGEAMQVLTLTDRRAKPLTVLKAGASNPHLGVEIGKPATAPTGERVQPVTLKLAADAPTGHRDETVLLLTDDPEYPELRVPVRVLKRVPGGVAAVPDSVAVRFAAGQTEVSQLVQLRSPDGKPITVTGAESDHPAVTVKWSAGPAALATVRVTVTDPGNGRPGTATVRVRLAEPAGHEVAIPVSWSGGKK